MAKSKPKTELGKAHLTDYGKRAIARMMYDRGRGFAGAAGLLSKQKVGHDYVVLHLLCQGMEIVLKAILLRVDFDHYQPRLRGFGHDLAGLAVAVTMAAKRKPLRDSLVAELKVVSDLYKAHHLRYAGRFDMFVHPDTVPTRRITLAFIALGAFVDRAALFEMPVTAEPPWPQQAGDHSSPSN
jgi:hypothetical protein